MRPLYEYHIEGAANHNSTEYRASLRRELRKALDSIADNSRGWLEGRALLHRSISRRRPKKEEIVGEIECASLGEPSWLLGEVRAAVERISGKVVAQRWRPKDSTRRVFYMREESRWKKVVAEPSGYALISPSRTECKAKTGVANLIIEVASTLDSIPERCTAVYMLAYYLYNTRPTYMLIATPPAVYVLALHPNLSKQLLTLQTHDHV